MSQFHVSWRYSLPASILLMAPFDVLASLAMDIYLPVVPHMPSELGGSPAVIQLTLSLYLVILGVGQLVFGPASDQVGRRPVLVGGAVLFSAASFGLAVSSSAGVFLLLRLLQALGASAALVATFATVRDVYAQRPEGVTIYGLFSSILAFVPALGPIAGALIAGAFGWRAIFIALGAAGLLATVNAIFRWHETRPINAVPARGSFWPILYSLAFWTYTLGFSAAMGTFFVFFSTAPRLLIERAGYSELEFSIAFSTVAVAMIITTRCSRRLIGQLGTARCLTTGMAALMFGAVLLSLGEVADQPSLLTFIVPMWIMAIGIVLAVSVTAEGALSGFEDRAGSAVALYFCAQSLIVGFFGTCAVITLRADTVWPLVAYSSGMAAAVLGSWFVLRRRSNMT